jgi:hypothetical protein
VILEEYQIRTGRLAHYLSLVRDEGLAIQQPILGNLIGCFQAEIGDLSHVVHRWDYADLNDRAERRRQRGADARWQAFSVKLSENIGSATNRIQMPTDVSPLR